MKWQVIHGDCRDVLPTLGQVDHVITDPPFNSRTSKNARSLLKSKAASGRLEQFIDFEGIDPAEMVPPILAVTKRWAVAFCALEQLGAYESASGDAWVRACVWAKPDGAPQFTGDRPAQAAEGIAVMHGAGRKRWNGGGARGLWTFSVVQARADFDHPTPKPLPLMLELVELFTDEGDVVLDPFCGSGTTGVACLRLGRRFIGIEKDARYHAVAVERLQAEERGLSLRDARAGQSSIFDAMGGAS